MPCGRTKYRYKGWYFELTDSFGPLPLQESGELAEIPTDFTSYWRAFWRMWDRFSKEPDKAKFGIKSLETPKGTNYESRR